MATNDLRRYVIQKAGTWTENQHLADTFRGESLLLNWIGDSVSLAGPLRLRITFFARNVTTAPGGLSQEQESELYSYILNVPPGHQWTYTLQDFTQITAHFGANAGYSVRIDEAGAEAVATVDPDAEVPCGFATKAIADCGQFFPAPCEGCPPGTTVNMPPGCGPTLAIPPATGGCLRPRFFNGMFITREDLETFVRWSRLKDQLHNRASGDGVVWGLDVCRDANAVLVQPGYAVDCCGHDLTVTAPYRVAGDLLLCDPAAREVLSQQGPQCLHLLLEYVECPEEPRPVHGDPCSPQSSYCEMSRIRETTRLRLVPPRHYQPQGPITDFVNTVREELERAGIQVNTPATAATAEAADIPDPLPTVFNVLPPDGKRYKVLPRFGATVEQQYSDFTPLGDSVVFTLQLEAFNGYQFIAGEVATGMVLARVTAPTYTLDWQVSPRDLQPDPAGLLHGDYTVANLELAPVTGSGAHLIVRMHLAITWWPYNFRAPGFMILRADQVEVTVVPPSESATWPCTTDPCCTQRPLFPVPFPWLNESPLKPGTAADPKVLVLAVVYAWLALEQSRRQAVATDPQASSGQQMLQGYAVKLVEKMFKLPSKSQLQKLAAALQKLLCGWCKGFLYPGPTCVGDPHGVVIGCVQVEGGRIASVDPWGGRRWVVHYPLLSHWGSQIGLASLDLSVSRVMAMVCCIAGLPVPGRGTGIPDLHVNLPGRKERLPLGNGYLSFEGEEQEDTGEMPSREDQGSAIGESLQTSRSEELPLLEFINRAASVLGEEPAGKASRLVRYTASGLPGVSLLVPEPAQPESKATVLVAQRQRLEDKVKEVAAATKTPVPTLLERFSRELTLDVLRVTGLKGLEDSPLRNDLAAAGVRTVADLLSHDLEDLHETLEGADGRALLALAEEAEKAALEVSRSVRGTVQKYSTDKNIVTPEEMAPENRRAEVSAALAKDIQGRKTLNVSPAVAGRLVQSALGRVAAKRPVAVAAAAAPTPAKPTAKTRPKRTKPPAKG